MVMLEYGLPESAAVMRPARRRLYSRYLGSWEVLITPEHAVCVRVFILFCSQDTAGRACKWSIAPERNDLLPPCEIL